MDTKERAKLVESMNNIILSLNDESYIDLWLMEGVADGEEDFEDFYTEDENFKMLGDLFIFIMRKAMKNGIYCDGILMKGDTY